MKQVIAIAAIAAVLTGCSSLGKKEFTEIKKVEGKVDQVPTWFIEPTEDNPPFIYGAGTGLSDALQFSVDKAMHEAKLVIAGKLSTEATSQLRTFITDNSAGAQSKTIQKTEKVSKTGFTAVYLPQYTTDQRIVFKEGNMYRTYVLIKIDTNKVKKEDVATNTFSSYEESQANQAFRSLDTPVIQEEQPNNGQFLPVQ